MNRIEDLVRESLRERVETPPALHEPADRAVSAAHRVRRRRALAVAGIAVVLATAGLSVFRWGTGDRPPPPAINPAPTPAATLPAVALVVNGNTLLLPGGRSVTVAAPTYGIQAFQVAQGYLASSHTPGTDTLTTWLVTPDGRMRTVLTGLRSWPVVEAGGFQVAWRDGTGLHTGHLSDKGDMVVDSSTKMTGPGNPIALTDPAVVLGSTDGFDLWVPSRGPYVPSWNVITQVAAVYGAGPDHKTVLGLVHQSPKSKATCLAEMDPTQSLHPLRTACGLHLVSDADGVMSPDGRWLAARTEDGRVAVIDLGTVFEHPSADTLTWPADRTGTWIDDHTMLAPAGGQLRRFEVTGDTGAPVEIAGLAPGTPFEPVPRA